MAALPGERPFLTRCSSRHLDHCDSLLTVCHRTSTGHCLSHNTPLLRSQHRLPAATHILSKTLVLIKGTSNLQALVKPSLSASGRLAVSPLKGSSGRSSRSDSSVFWSHSGGINSSLKSPLQSHCTSFVTAVLLMSCFLKTTPLSSHTATLKTCS